MKRAICVGISDYEKISDLMGGENDARALASRISGEEEALAIKLINSSAKKYVILETIRSVCKISDPGDDVFFSFSGHGSQIEDQNGDEEDGYDEVLCPYDMDWDVGTYITDDELAEAFAYLHHDATLTMLLDCCHSGTAMRGANVRFLSPQENHFQRKIRQISGKIRQKNTVIWTACEDGEYSVEKFFAMSGCRGVFSLAYQMFCGSPRIKMFEKIHEFCVHHGGQHPSLIVNGEKTKLTS